MVHVKKCPLGKRGRPSTEFWKDGKPQIYCRGWIDKMTDEPLNECRACSDWAEGEQVHRDIQTTILEWSMEDKQ